MRRFAFAGGRGDAHRAAARTLFALAAALALAPLGARADEPTRTEERRSSTLAAAFAPIAARASVATVAVLSVEGDELGYGVAVEDGRTILTSRSILERVAGRAVAIRTASGDAGTATILGRNEAYDVAALGVATRLPRLEAATLGRSGSLAVGQWVVSVGASGSAALAVGVVSALGRRVEPRPGEAQAVDLFGLFSENGGPRRAYARVIQHDGPIDGDKHGAPLFDAEGRLVGVNVANVYRGSSYAAPIDDVMGFLGDLKAGRPGPALPRPGYLGVAVGVIADPAIVKSRAIAGTGVEIREVQPGLPAAKAGLRPGDVVLGVGGEKVRSLERFGLLVRAATPGETLVVRILRGGKDELEVPVVVGERPEGE
jgi:putative serine protease PepD